MEPIEIIVIIVASLIVLSVLGTYLYKKAKHLPTGDCDCCSSKSSLVKKDKHKYGKKAKKEEPKTDASKVDTTKIDSSSSSDVPEEDTSKKE